jgi:hypothetical protein
MTSLTDLRLGTKADRPLVRSVMARTASTFLAAGALVARCLPMPRIWSAVRLSARRWVVA